MKKMKKRKPVKVKYMSSENGYKIVAKDGSLSPETYATKKGAMQGHLGTPDAFGC